LLALIADLKTDRHTATTTDTDTDTDTDHEMENITGAYKKAILFTHLAATSTEILLACGKRLSSFSRATSKTLYMIKNVGNWFTSEAPMPDQ